MSLSALRVTVAQKRDLIIKKRVAIESEKRLIVDKVRRLSALQKENREMTPYYAEFEDIFLRNTRIQLEVEALLVLFDEVYLTDQRIRLTEWNCMQREEKEEHSCVVQ
jgi:hypothetical protein